MNFDNKVIIVTGASEGIGRAVCHALSAWSVKLVIAARNKERLLSLQQELSSTKADVLPITTDVTDQQQCTALIDQTIAHFGQLDILINNAGMTMWSSFEELEDLNVFQRLYDINVMSCVYCTKAAIPHLKKTKGHIVGVSSVAGLTGVPTRTAYSASKHAMIGFFDALRIELQDDDISISVICPDFVVSEIHKRAIGKDGGALGNSPMKESKIMSTETCATLMLEAIAKKQRLAVLSNRGKAGRWLKLIWPSLIDKLAKKAISQKH